MAFVPPKDGGGRPAMTMTQQICWNQRIEREMEVNGKARPMYSVRAAASKEEVPADFKPGHVNPPEKIRQLDRTKGFDLEAAGWDRDGPDAKTFRRAMNGLVCGPRDRQAFPETANQEMGWFLSAPGPHKERMQRNKMRMGIGWPEEAPANFSQVSAEFFHPNSVISRAAPGLTGVSATAPLGSRVSATAPRTSDVSVVAPGELGSALSQAAPSRLSASASALSATRPVGGPPGGTTRVQWHDGAKKLGESASLPAIPTAVASMAGQVKYQHAESKLRGRERKLHGVLEDVMSYQSKGHRGNKYDHPCGSTDATQFDGDYILKNGMPLYKAKKEVPFTLMSPKGGPSPPWKIPLKLDVSL